MSRSGERVWSTLLASGFGGLGRKTTGGRFSGLGLKTRLEFLWEQERACDVIAKLASMQSKVMKTSGSFRYNNKNMDGFTPNSIGLMKSLCLVLVIETTIGLNSTLVLCMR